MGNPVSIRKRVMLMKQETTRGTLIAWPGSWADADFDVEFFNVTVTRELAEYQRIYLLGDHDRLASVFGKRMATVTASVDLRYSGTVDTAPKLRKLFGICGLLETNNAAVSVDWRPDKSADLGGGLAAGPPTIDLPYDIVVYDEVMGSSPKAIATVIRGALANGKLVMDELGNPIRLDIEARGVLHSIEDVPNASLLTPTALDTSLPNTVLSAIITVGGVAQRINKLELDFGNVVELEGDPSDAAGLLAAVIKERNPTLSIDPLMDLVATDDVWSDWPGSVESVLAFNTTNWFIDADKCQIITLADAEQPAARSWDKVFSLNRDGVNGYPWIITHK